MLLLLRLPIGAISLLLGLGLEDVLAPLPPGEDWLVSSCLEVSAGEVAGLLRNAHSLQLSACRWLAAFADGRSEERDPDDDTLQSIAQARQHAGRRLVNCMQIHKQIPIALGSKASGLEHKTHAILHALMMETVGMDHLQREADTIASFTTDMGVEFGIADAEGGSIDVYFPSWVRQRLQPDSMDESNFGSSVPTVWRPIPEMRNFPMPNAFVVPGMLHILDNLEHSMDNTLCNFKDWLPGLQAITTLLGEKHHRELFVEKCIRSRPEFRHFEDLFKTDMHTTKKWRWGAVVDVLNDLMRVMGALSAAWCQSRFLSGPGLSMSDVGGGSGPKAAESLGGNVRATGPRENSTTRHRWGAVGPRGTVGPRDQTGFDWPWDRGGGEKLFSVAFGPGPPRKRRGGEGRRGPEPRYHYSHSQ
eukprot:9223486-Pyramimonas_sp.AAC.2